VAVTYSMTRLQGLPDAPYLVTLNPRGEPAGILDDVTFTHPQFDRAALAAQAELPRLGGTDRTYYAGAHFGFGFHEDGLRSGLAAARLAADEYGGRCVPCSAINLPGAVLGDCDARAARSPRPAPVTT
jgi:predicted NAD/FAD-binding protein